MEITLIRHLPTEWNKKHKLQGKRDIPILPISVKDQCDMLDNALLLRGKCFEYVLCSALQRTEQTAFAYGYEPIKESLLNELDFGKFEGRPKSELLAAYGDQWLENPREMVLGESLLNLEQRIIHFLKKYKDASSILVFGHGSWMRAFISYHKYGHINNMNKRTVENNESISLEFMTVEA